MPDKERERWYLETLRRAFPDLPPGTPTEPEPPDFLLGDGDRRLGIEMTVFHLPPTPGNRPHQEQQRLKEQIVDRAEAIHARSGGPALYVGVFFNPRYVLTKQDLQPLAHAIAESVLRTPSPRSMREPIELPWRERPAQVSGIQIHPSIDGSDKLWHPDAGGWVASITAAHIEAVVAAKARSAIVARARCDELWLVIVHDLFGRAAPAELSSEASDASYSGPFDRLLWFVPHAPERALQLRISSPAA